MNVSFVSLGCDKNRVNTEQMMALCLQAGITVQEDCPGSDVVVINTCGFIDSAKSEAIDTILSAAQLKDAGEIQKILVTGCLSQRYQADILEELPEIDGIMGTGCFGDIVPALEQVMEGRECRHFADINGPVEELPRVLSTPRHYAYLRIAEGCSNRCAYCVIPSLRGKYRSRPMNELLDEAAELASAGVKELIVIAQDITKYGMDLPEHKRLLPELLRELCKMDFTWIRLHYLYPDQITDELIDVIADEPKIVKYLDIPLQHVSKRILRAMHRPGDGAEFTRLIEDMRERIPGLVLRTSLIVGLPGEDKEKVAHTLEKVEALNPDSLTVHSLALKRATRLNLFKDKYQEISFENSAEIMKMTMDSAHRMEMGPYYMYRQKNMAGNFENVGYSREGKAGIYNILIMEEKQSILAAGAGASTKFVFEHGERIERVENVKDLKNYVERIDEMIERKRIGMEKYLPK